MSLRDDIDRAIRGIDEGWSLPEVRQYLLFMASRFGTQRSFGLQIGPTLPPGDWARPRPSQAPRACPPQPTTPPVPPAAAHPLRPPAPPEPPARAPLNFARANKLTLSHCSANFEGWDESWYCIDCQQLSRDPSTRWLGWHWGHHPVLLSETLRAEEFPSVLSQVHQIVTGMSSADEVKIMFHCKGGRHRSLSCLLIVEHCLANEGFEVEMIPRTSKHPHDFGECSKCTGELNATDSETLRALWDAFRPEE